MTDDEFVILYALIESMEMPTIMTDAGITGYGCTVEHHHNQEGRATIERIYIRVATAFMKKNPCQIFLGR